MTSLTRSQVEGALLQLTGSFLRNPLRCNGGCARCTGACSPGWDICYACANTYAGKLPDAMGFMTYAAQGTQAGAVMHGYKSKPPMAEHEVTVALLAYLGRIYHSRCAEVLVHAPITHWSVVPSTSGRPGDHPLLRLTSADQPMPLWPLTRHPAAPVPSRQSTTADLFAANPLPANSHVLLIEDTFVSGTRPISATRTLRAVGAAHVTLLCVARWLSAPFIGSHAPRDSLLVRSLLPVYDPAICPYTGVGCP